MAYQNKFDKTGRASQQGAKAEQVFKESVDAFFDVDISPSDLVNQFKHIDYHCDLPMTVDVKAIKDPETIWVELKNVQGKEGWLYGEATHIAFQRPLGFVVVRRLHLLELVERLVDMDAMVSSPAECLYKLYSRSKWGRKDLLTTIKPADLNTLPYVLIKK
jgi:hypothetical protein